MLKNYMEDMVDVYLPEIFEDEAEKYGDICKCASCLASIKAETLNNVEPFYVTCKIGEVYGEYSWKEQQKRADLLVAIARAIETVHARAHKDTNSGGQDSLTRALLGDEVK